MKLGFYITGVNYLIENCSIVVNIYDSNILLAFILIVLSVE